MPNYSYKCCKSKLIHTIELPISFDPARTIPCECCNGRYTMSRVIKLTAQFPEKVGKVWAGDWFRKTYGFDMGEQACTQKQLKEDMAKAERLYKKENEI